MSDLHEMAARSRAAAWQLADAPAEKRDLAMGTMAEALKRHRAEIFSANDEDVREAE